MQSRCLQVELFQSTRPGWGEAGERDGAHAVCDISIHSPRVGRGFQGDVPGLTADGISIHSPRVGRGGIKAVAL